MARTETLVSVSLDHWNRLAARAEAAESRVAELEAGARALLDAMTRFGPDDNGQLWDAAYALRALVDDETPEETT